MEEKNLEQETSRIFKTGFVDCKGLLNMRNLPLDGATVLRRLTPNTEVRIITTLARYFKICLADGQEGYCAKEFIKIKK